ncbi:hypothetical protein GOBAR_AA36980 [Gossypium barbadense]|uniref:Uncharacterized protein n=1 Tax=Gossypium barbadense TaxID=3634 RepID=A0A2P5VY07_GOSBA|nr:hypothetical protein GOBAR_AA36980 [Gossypium barbadense]
MVSFRPTMITATAPSSALSPNAPSMAPPSFFPTSFKTTTFDYENNEGEQQEERIVDFQFVYKGLELGRRDAAALFFLVSFLSAAYGWVILGFTTIYSLVSGVLFVTTVNDLIGRFVSFFGAFWDGSKIGLKRLTGFVLIKWAVRDAVTQLLGFWYFGEIEDHYSFFKLFVRLKLMPFSVTSPWIRGYEKEISGFLFTWFLVDTLVSFAFSLAAWIAIVDSRRTGREIITEGCYLMSTLLNQAIQIKCYEAISGGSLARWVLTHIGGEFFAMVIQAALEVYFMVAWLIFYFVVRCREANADVLVMQYHHCFVKELANALHYLFLAGINENGNFSHAPNLADASIKIE